MSLVGIPGDRPSATSEAHVWINPEHITQLTPIVTATGDSYTLMAELKLTGMPLFRSHLGMFAERAELDTEWQRFLGQFVS